ncbi:MAG: NADH:ubiquinone reductase (Na(+)-transporting) subunit B [Flavobacteriales bacterium]|nr:NADH:ubiquinone reductase (Na(+)-transporting) subunit B [Flavobacteriales bacterium]
MKFLENFVRKLEPSFKEGGKLHKFHPVYDGLATFLFTPDHTTHKGAHIRDGIDLKRTMVTVILALVPAMIFGMWNVGHWHFTALGETASMGDKFIYGLIKVLPIIVVSYAAGLGVEFAFCIAKGHQIQEGFLVSGLLIPLVMPPDVPLWMVALGTIFAVIFAKEVFGGTGMNIVNVALTARAFLFFAYPTFTSGEVWISGDKTKFIDGYTGATNLGHLATLVDNPTQKEAVMTKVATLQDTFLGIEPGSIGETSALAILIGGVILILTGIGSFRIMASMFAGGFVMQSIFNAWGANPYMEVDPMHQLMMGGFMFGMVFMVTDPVTAAQTATGKIIYGFLAGMFSIMIRVFNPAYPEGVMMAILLANVLAPTIDHFVIQSNIKRRLNRAKLKTA